MSNTHHLKGSPRMPHTRSWINIDMTRSTLYIKDMKIIFHCKAFQSWRYTSNKQKLFKAKICFKFIKVWTSLQTEPVTRLFPVFPSSLGPNITWSLQVLVLVSVSRRLTIFSMCVCVWCVGQVSSECIPKTSAVLKTPYQDSNRPEPGFYSLHGDTSEKCLLVITYLDHAVRFIETILHTCSFRKQCFPRSSNIAAYIIINTGGL